MVALLLLWTGDGSYVEEKNGAHLWIIDRDVSKAAYFCCLVKANAGWPDWRLPGKTICPPYKNVENLKGNVVFVKIFDYEFFTTVHCDIFFFFFLLRQTNFPSGTAILMSLDIMSCNDRTRILHKRLWLDESLTKSPRKTAVMWNSLEFFFLLFFSRWDLGSLCSCHRLNSQWLCLLYQTHKVPLFHCCTSITHGNRICFVSVAATSVNRSETSEVKGKGFSKQTWSISDLNRWACPSS